MPLSRSKLDPELERRRRKKLLDPVVLALDWWRGGDWEGLLELLLDENMLFRLVTGASSVWVPFFGGELVSSRSGLGLKRGIPAKNDGVC